MAAPDEFHEDVHPDAREITGNRQYGEWGQCIATAKSTGERCRGYAQGSHGKCRAHGGSDDSGAPEGNKNAEDNDGGAPEENDNAVTHGAYADLAKRPLIEGEKTAMKEAEEKLEDPADSKVIARTAASYCLMMGHRSQDPRWFRRFEGICDKFAIAPEEVSRTEVDVSGEVSHDHDHQHELDENTQDVLDQMTGGDS